MFGLFKKKLAVDPIAEKLHANTPAWLVASDLRASKKPRVINNELSAEEVQEILKRHEMYKNADPVSSGIDMMEFYSSDDEQVLEFVRRLGVNPELADKITIQLEHNQPVRISMSSYALKYERNGTTLKWEPQS